MIHDKVYNATNFIDEHPYVFTSPNVPSATHMKLHLSSPSPASLYGLHFLDEENPTKHDERRNFWGKNG